MHYFSFFNQEIYNNENKDLITWRIINDSTSLTESIKLGLLTSVNGFNVNNWQVIEKIQMSDF